MRSVQDIPLIGIGIGLIVVVGLIVGVGGVVTSDERPPIGQAPPITENITAEGELEAQSQSLSESPRTYAVTATSADAIDADQLAEYGDVGTQADDRIELRMSPSDVATVQNLSWVTNVRPVIRSEPTQTGTQTEIPGSSEGVGEDNSLGVQQAHQSDITGEDVEVGIIDTGFDPNNPAIASNVVETRSFREFDSERDPAHGTSVGEIVTRTAPDSQLYLASADTGTDTKAAIDYLKRQDVDIIVHSRNFFDIKDDGNHFFTDEVNAATDSGTLFVNSAGNYAQTHWEGDFRDTNEDGFHEWTASGDELNSLPDSTSDFSGGEVIVSVHWDNDGDSSDYKPYLYNPGTEEYIVEGQSGLRTETNQYARISADVAQQPLSLVIENTQGPANDEIEVTVIEGPEEIQRNIPASSIAAPADVPAALAIAAYERGQNQLAPYSSRGPTDDGRTGIGVTGYTNIEVTNGFYESGIFGGTSAAAPYVGGIAALVEENQAGDQSPTELTSTLKSSSDDILDPGTDTASGPGVVNAADAVDVAEGTLTGEIRGQEDTLIADVGLEVSLERQTSTGGFEQIRTPRQVSDGQYTFEGLATGEEYRVVAEFQGESGSATVAELRAGTNTRDIVIADITVGGITSSDVTLSDSTPSRGSNVTVTVTATPENGNVGFKFEHLFNQSVATASAPTAQIGGISVDPIASSVGQNGATVTLGADDVTAGEQITIEYTITTAETAGQTVSLTGSVTNGDTQELPEISYTTTDTDTDPEDTGAIVGDIVRVDGSEIENVEQLKIRILQDGVEITGDPTNSPVQPDANGEYTAFVPVASGSGSGGSSYTVEVSSPRLEQAFAQQITVFPGETENLDIRLIPKDTGVTQEQELRLDVTVANGDGTQVKSAPVPPGDQRNVQVRVTARPIDAASGTPFAPVAGQDVTLELTDRAAGELGVGSSTTPEVTVTTTDTGIATTTFESSVRRSGNTNVTASTRNANDVLFETDSVRGRNLNDNGDQAEIKTAGTLTGDVRDQNDVLIQQRVVNVLLEKNGRPVKNRTIDEGQYNFENLEAGEQYRVTATFQGESGSATVEELIPGTNTRDIVIEEITLEDEDEEDGSTIDVTRTVSADEVAPNDQVTVTTEMTGVSGAVSTTSSYDPQVASATVQSVTVNGASASPIIATAEVAGSVVTLGDVGTGTDATVRITEELTVGEETDVTHEITGEVTAGETTTEVDPVSVTVAEPQSVVDEYDTDNDGTISITELGAAGADFASGELTITELGRLGAEFAS